MTRRLGGWLFISIFFALLIHTPVAQAVTGTGGVGPLPDLVPITSGGLSTGPTPSASLDLLQGVVGPVTQNAVTAGNPTGSNTTVDYTSGSTGDFGNTTTPAATAGGGGAIGSGICEPPKQMNFDHVASCLDPKNTAFPWITDVWKWSLSLINIFAVIVLIAMAFANILYPLKFLEPYRIRQVLPGFIWGIVLANLSMFICRAVVTFADILMQQTHLLNKLSSNATILQSLYRSWGIVPSYLSWGVISAKFVDPNPDNFAMLYQLLVATLLIYAPIIALVCLAFIFYFRFAVIFALTAISPLAFGSLMFPATQKFLGQWWDYFWKWTFGGVASYLLLFLASQIRSNSAYESSNTVLINIVPYALTLFLVWLAVQAPLKMGGALAAGWAGLGKLGLSKTWGATKFTAGAALGVGRYGAQHFARWNDNDWMKLRDKAGAEGRTLTLGERGKWLLGHAGNILSKPAVTYYGAKKGLELKKGAHEKYLDKAIKKSLAYEKIGGRKAAIDSYAEAKQWIHGATWEAVQGEYDDQRKKNPQLSDKEFEAAVEKIWTSDPKEHDGLMRDFGMTAENFATIMAIREGVNRSILNITRGQGRTPKIINALANNNLPQYAFGMMREEELFKKNIRENDSPDVIEQFAQNAQAHGGTAAAAAPTTAPARASAATPPPATPPPTGFANGSGTNNSTASTVTASPAGAGASVAATAAAVNRTKVVMPATRDAAMRLAVEQAVTHLGSIEELRSSGLRPEQVRTKIEKVFQRAVPGNKVNEYDLSQELKRQFGVAGDGAVRDKMMEGLTPIASQLSNQQSHLKVGSINERRGVTQVFEQIKQAPAGTHISQHLATLEQESQRILTELPSDDRRAQQYITQHRDIIVRVIPNFRADMRPNDLRGRLQEQIVGAATLRQNFHNDLQARIHEAELNLNSQHVEVAQKVEADIGAYYHFARGAITDPTNTKEFVRGLQKSREVINRAAEHAALGYRDPEQLKITQQVIAEISPAYAAHIRTDDGGQSANAILKALQQGDQMFERQVRAQLGKGGQKLTNVFANMTQRYANSSNTGIV